VRCWGLAALLLVLSISRALAAQVLPVLEGQYVGVTLHELPLPESLVKDLKSGLTNRLLVRALLLEQTHSIAQQSVEMAIRYDLWDETFSLTITISGRVTATQTVASVEEVVARLKDSRFPKLFATSGLNDSQSLVVRVDLLLNPIEKERMEQIQKWVAQNTTPAAPVDPDRPASTAPLGQAAADAIFNKIFEQYAGGANIASAWRVTLASQPFTLKELTHVRP
jgi:hypothetical protein